MERAGCDPAQYNGLIGLYAGASPNIHWQAQSLLNGSNRAAAEFSGIQLHDKDFMSTRVSYKLGLKGPSLTMYSACSTSLVAVDAACQGLLTGRCDIALAGGISIWLPQKTGYHYEAGMLFSKSGRCRSFDRDADGTIFSDGGGLVALKRLNEAIAGRDPIQAVILGSFTNNDGNQKAGYTAPGINGEAAVIRNAIKIAGIDGESISYIETHGSATQLGDSIELQAMKLAFASSRKQFCAIGSVKSNIGHLNAAAGIAGLIKTVLALKHRLLPPSIHFTAPNPQLALSDSPFYINDTLSPWKTGDGPLRAGVSSFGIGGTNAHVVLEEAPPKESRSGSNPYSLLPLSGKTPQAVSRSASGLRQYLEAHPALDLADAAYTLQTGRQHFQYRDASVCASREEALQLLTKFESRECDNRIHSEGLKVVFMFTGLGAQYTGMGRGLYSHSQTFREEAGRCFEILRPLAGMDCKELLFQDSQTGPSALGDPLFSQLAMFVFQYALARLLMRWGIQPEAMIGYSFGEYTAACLGGMLSLEEALNIVAARGKTMRTQSMGKMVSVPLDKESLLPYLPDTIHIAINNGPSCVIAGAPEDIDAFCTSMKGERYLCVEFPSTHAMHSPLMTGMAAEFEVVSANTSLKPPQIKVISNVTGTWFEEDDIGPRYWSKHLTHTVRFADGISTILSQGPACFVEIGPGHDLRLLVSRQFAENSPNRAVNLVKPANQTHPDLHYLMKRLAFLWKYGVSIDWPAVHAPARPNKVTLPAYPFEKTVFDISIQDISGISASNQCRGQCSKRRDIADWFYIPSWKRTLRPSLRRGPTNEPRRWLLLADGNSLGQSLRDSLQALGHTVMSIPFGPEDRTGATYIDRFEDLLAQGKTPHHIVHLWSEANVEEIETQLYKGLHSLTTIAATLEQSNEQPDTTVWVVTGDVYPVTGSESLSPARATIIAPLKTLPQEFPFIHCRHIDLEHSDVSDPGSAERTAALLVPEFQSNSQETIVAYRSGNRFTQGFEPTRIESDGDSPHYLKTGGVYMVTGGLGNIGFALSRYLAGASQGTLILTGRSSVSHVTGSLDKKAGKIRQLEELGAAVHYFQADAANETEMQTVIAETLRRCGALNGVIHAAGIMDKSILTSASAIGPDDWRLQFPPKVQGISVLEKVLGDLPLDFVLVTSSLSPLLGGIGLTVYAAANVYMDTFVHRHNRRHPVRWTTVNWADWEFPREQADEAEETKLAALFTSSEMNISIDDGIDTFQRILSHCEEAHIIVSAGDLETRIRQWITDLSVDRGGKRDSNKNYYKPRPDLMTAYAQPEDDLQQTLAEKWKRIFAIEGIGVDDDFFELGGDSLKALAFISTLHRESKLLIEVGDFFKHPTIRGLAALLAQGDNGRHQEILPVEQKEYYDLSHAQQRLWVIDQLEQDLVAYNLTSALEFHRGLDPDALAEAYKKVVARHESLRTIFKLVDGEPKQVIRPFHEIGFSVKRIDLRNHPSPEEEAEALADMDKRIPFNLQTGPLIRVTLLILKEKYIKLFSVHHVICDGLSLNVLLRDWLAFYHHLKGDPNSISPTPPTLQYKDFSHWHNRHLQQDSIVEHREYWRETLAGENPILELPTDFPRPDVKTYNGSSLVFELETNVRNSVTELCKKRRASLYMLILATVKTLLYSYSHQRDITVGAVLSGREYGGLDDQIGFYANTLPIRSSIATEESFESFLHKVRHSLLQAYQHQIFPFDMIVETLRLTTPPSRNPLFDVIVVLQNIDVSDEGDEGNRMIFSGNKDQWASSSFDLTFSFYSDSNRMCFTIRYNTDLFEEASIQLMGRRLNKIFTAIVKEPGTSIENLSNIEIESTSNQKVAAWEIDF